LRSNGEERAAEHFLSNGIEASKLAECRILALLVLTGKIELLMENLIGRFGQVAEFRDGENLSSPEG